MNSKKSQTRFLIQNNHHHQHNHHKQPSFISIVNSNNVRPSRESIKKDIEQFQPPPNWSTIPRHELFIKYPTIMLVFFLFFFFLSLLC